MLVVPLAALPAQTVAVSLGEQSCRLDVQQKSTGLYLSLFVADVPIVTGVRCLDRVSLVLSPYAGFRGDLAFVDTQGTSDPTYDGLAGRYTLVYLEP